MNEKVLEAVTLLKRHIRNQPQIGIILGSGLGGLVEMVIEAKYYAAPSAAQAFSHFPEEYTTMRVTACSRSCFRSG
jgi:purine nucleoside phosphorylase